MSHTQKSFSLLARAAIQVPALQRPDWTKNVPRDPRLLWLDKNENNDPALAALTRRILHDIDPKCLAVYPECSPFYSKLADYLGVNPYFLLLAPGSDGVIRAVFETFINPGDIVIHTQPSYAMYAVYSRMFGATAVTLEYQQNDQGPRLSMETVIDNIRKIHPKLICLPNPDSPTGTFFPPEQLLEIIGAAGDVGALILIDEAYYPFYPHSAAALVEHNKHLIVAQTFSKAWGLTGLRLGYGIANLEIAGLLHKVRPNYEVNMVAIAVAERMLDYGNEMAASVKRLNQGRDHFIASMNEIGFRTFPCQGSFLHVAFGPNASAVHDALKNIALYRQDFNVPCLKGFSRFSSTTVELFQPLIDRIIEVVKTAREQ
jgi:histidinol-phosphate aminotransferase